VQLSQSEVNVGVLLVKRLREEEAPPRKAMPPAPEVPPEPLLVLPPHERSDIPIVFKLFYCLFSHKLNPHHSVVVHVSPNQRELPALHLLNELGPLFVAVVFEPRGDVQTLVGLQVELFHFRKFGLVLGDHVVCQILVLLESLEQRVSFTH